LLLNLSAENKMSNGKKLTTTELNLLRKEAVSLRLQQYSLNRIQELTGLTHPTIISAFNRFRRGGWEAVNIKGRGRPKGDKALAVDKRICIDVLTQTPAENIQQGHYLWTTELFHTWLCSHFKIEKSVKFSSRLLDELGFNPKVNVTREITAKKWLEQNFSQALQKQILKGGLTFIGGAEVFSTYRETEDKLNNDNPVTLLFVRDLRGKLYWWSTRGALDEDMIYDFVQRLVSQFKDNNITFFFHSYSLNRMKKLTAWLENQTGLDLYIFNDELLGKDKLPKNLVEKLPIQNNYLNGLPNNPQNSSINQSYVRNAMALTHLQRLEAESIQIMREVVSETENPVMLYSVGKDSAVMLHLAMKAFYPSKPPFALLHVDTGWKFRDMYTFRDRLVKDLGMELITYTNPEGLEKNINPFTHGSALHTDIMKTVGLKQALDKYGFDAAFGGARRDEEKSRAKERVFSFRTAEHRWDPKNQRPELWKQYNAKKHKGESIRVFPISNWTELDVWQYIHKENIPTVPLYLAAERPVVERDGMLIMVDDERMPLLDGEVPMMKKVRFRTLGCYPLTGAIESEADTLPSVIQEMLLTKTSERQGRMIDKDSSASMEKKKQEGYF